MLDLEHNIWQPTRLKKTVVLAESSRALGTVLYLLNDDME